MKLATILYKDIEWYLRNGISRGRVIKGLRANLADVNTCPLAMINHELTAAQSCKLYKEARATMKSPYNVYCTCHSSKPHPHAALGIKRWQDSPLSAREQAVVEVIEKIQKGG